MPIQAGTGCRKAWRPLATSAKAYGQLKAKLRGMQIPITQMAQIPLWDNTVFQTDTGVSYKSSKLVRMGVLKVEDLLVMDKLDKEKMRHIAPTWQGLYRQGIQWMLKQRDEGKEEIRIRGQQVAVDQWALKKVAAAMALTNKPEERQAAEVWAVLDKLQAPWKLKAFVGQALWRKLAVNLRLQKKKDQR